MYDVFCSTQDVETGEIFVSSASTNDLRRCFTDCYNCVRIDEIPESPSCDSL